MHIEHFLFKKNLTQLHIIQVAMFRSCTVLFNLCCKFALTLQSYPYLYEFAYLCVNLKLTAVTPDFHHRDIKGYPHFYVVLF